jgi:MoaA/NifB/PqqE/SkfB family radical SAM enzyme
MLTSGPEYDYRLKNANTILSWLENYNEPIRINMSGNGDPLASAIMRPIIKNFHPKARQTFMLSTNGLLIKKQISDGLPIFDSITTFKISVDAGSKEVYEDVRRPGKWAVLLENFDYLNVLGKTSSVQLMFALQNKNYKDIPHFVNLCNRYGFYGVIHQLDDWGTWAQMKSTNPDVWTIQNGVFADHDVLNSAHPNHNECKQIVTQYCNSKNITFAPMVLELLGG